MKTLLFLLLLIITSCRDVGYEIDTVKLTVDSLKKKNTMLNSKVDSMQVYVDALVSKNGTLKVDSFLLYLNQTIKEIEETKKRIENIKF